MKKRVYFWDNYKGILMFLVVFGHFIYKLFAELGADIILGDHAHVIQPIEYIGDTSPIPAGCFTPATVFTPTTM